MKLLSQQLLAPPSAVPQWHFLWPVKYFWCFKCRKGLSLIQFTSWTIDSLLLLPLRSSYEISLLCVTSTNINSVLLFFMPFCVSAPVMATVICFLPTHPYKHLGHSWDDDVSKASWGIPLFCTAFHCAQSLNSYRKWIWESPSEIHSSDQRTFSQSFIV